MSAVARTVFVFGIYVVVIGLTLMVRPDIVLTVLGLPATEEPWIHLLGYLAMVIGAYYLVAARSEAAAIVRASVPLRLVSAVIFIVVAALWGYWPVMLFAIPDAVGAAWTWSALHRTAPGFGT